MSIERENFDDVTQADLQELIDAQVPEGLRIEYKQANYGNTDAEKRELLKDVSAFSNTSGGHLVIGIEENAGIATKLLGVDIDADSEILRMEQMLRNAIEPPIAGIRMRAITLDTGSKVLLLRIPRSWNPPHRVTAQAVNKFFIRNSAGVSEPGIEELRTLFSQSTSALERARQFRNDRIYAVTNSESHRPLINDGRLFIHIVPAAAFSGMINLNVETIYSVHDAFSPLDASGMTPRFNFNGFINERGGETNRGYTQIFRNGVLEATLGGIVRKTDDGSFISGGWVERIFFKHIAPYINGLKNISVPPPLIIMITFEGVRDARYIVDKDLRNDSPPPILDNPLFLPECLLQDYGSEIEYHKAVRPAFDALWNASGYAKSLFFNKDGMWAGVWLR